MAAISVTERPMQRSVDGPLRCCPRICSGEPVARVDRAESLDSHDGG